MTWETFTTYLLPLGGWGVIVSGASGALSKFIADRAIEKEKAALVEKTEQLKGELAGELERLKAVLGRETDTYRLKLKKQELLFDQELGAAREFMRIHRLIRPSYSHPDMDWDEACTDVARGFASIEVTLETYLVQHGAVLDALSRNEIEECRTAASHYKFEAWDHEQLFAGAVKKAAEVLESLPKIEERLISQLRA